ncbi:hypothetical protein C8R45DRAFT_1155079 [Mycena sanguinolenta]|nr:hypothetical protein C8R45DRAFT_1155079 [Mycena sanguinolenta]
MPGVPGTQIAIKHHICDTTTSYQVPLQKTGSIAAGVLDIADAAERVVHVVAILLAVEQGGKASAKVEGACAEGEKAVAIRTPRTQVWRNHSSRFERTRSIDVAAQPISALHPPQKAHTQVMPEEMRMGTYRAPAAFSIAGNATRKTGKRRRTYGKVPTPNFLRRCVQLTKYATFAAEREMDEEEEVNLAVYSLLSVCELGSREMCRQYVFTTPYSVASDVRGAASARRSCRRVAGNVPRICHPTLYHTLRPIQASFVRTACGVLVFAEHHKTSSQYKKTGMWTDIPARSMLRCELTQLNHIRAQEGHGCERTRRTSVVSWMRTIQTTGRMRRVQWAVKRRACFLNAAGVWYSSTAECGCDVEASEWCTDGVFRTLMAWIAARRTLQPHVGMLAFIGIPNLKVILASFELLDDYNTWRSFIKRYFTVKKSLELFNSEYFSTLLQCK